MKVRSVLLPTDRGFKAETFRYVSGNSLQGSNALYSHVFMLFMFACMKNDWIADAIQDSDRHVSAYPNGPH